MQEHNEERNLEIEYIALILRQGFYPMFRFAGGKASIDKFIPIGQRKTPKKKGDNAERSKPSFAELKSVFNNMIPINGEEK